MRFFNTHESITHTNNYANGEQNANKDAKTTLIHTFCASVHATNSMGISMLSAILLHRRKDFLNTWSPKHDAQEQTDVSANKS